LNRETVIREHGHADIQLGDAVTANQLEIRTACLQHARDSVATQLASRNRNEQPLTQRPIDHLRRIDIRFQLEQRFQLDRELRSDYAANQYMSFNSGLSNSS
jgi:hypothetical protein